MVVRITFRHTASRQACRATVGWQVGGLVEGGSSRVLLAETFLLTVSRIVAGLGGANSYGLEGLGESESCRVVGTEEIGG